MAPALPIFLGQGPCHFALIDARNERSFVQRANAIGLRYTLSQRIEGFNISIGRPVALDRVPLGGNAMTAANGLKSRRRRGAVARCAVAPAMWPRRSRCWCARRAFMREIGGRWRRSSLPSRPRLAVVIFLLGDVLDRRRRDQRRSRICRAGSSGSSTQITDFGKSGWFLWPLGILFLALAALPSLPRMPQLVLAAVMVRVGFLFVAIGVPGLFVNIVKHIFGRARPVVGGSLDPYLFSPFSWPAAYAGLPSGHATTAFSVLVAFGTLWPRARTILWIYALADRGEPRGGDRALSDRRAGRRPGRRGRRAAGAPLVRAAAAWVSRSGRTARCINIPGPSLKRIKSVARELLA